MSAILEVNPDAFVIADQLDAERACGKLRGPLHGIPFVVKVRSTDPRFAFLGQADF